MSLSDFPISAARCQDGYCPICDDELLTIGRTGRPLCASCDLLWTVALLPDGRVTLSADRPLTREQIKRLYDREEGAS